MQVYLFIIGLFLSFNVSAFDVVNTSTTSSLSNLYSKSCALPYGGSIPHNGTVTLFQSASVPFGNLCVSQVRTCKNGFLSGSYVNRTCAVAAAPVGTASCTLNYGGGGTVLHNTSVTAYQNVSVAFGSSCVSQQRTCTNGVLSGTYANKTCAVNALVPAGATFTYCSNEGGACNFSGTRNVLYGPSATDARSIVKTFTSSVACTNAVFTNPAPGISKYCYYQNDIVAAPAPVGTASCTYSYDGGGTVAHNSSITAYQNVAVAFGSSCVSQQRTCSNGVLSGTYTNKVCTVNAQVPAGATFTFCASENGTCAFSGTRNVLYGPSATDARSVIKTFTSSVACTNAVFTDVAYGTGKSCYYQNDIVVAPAPVGSVPVITFTQVPANNTTSMVDQVSFNVVTASTNRQVQCSLDSAAFSNCTSPIAVMVMVGSHNFRVRVTDVTYNLSTTVTHAWAVIAAPPASNYLPYVNTSLYPAPALGYSTVRVQPTSQLPGVGNGGGQFRISCAFSHMANNDPIVFPGITGGSHSHTFFGNTAINAFSTPETLRAVGNSTCDGGLMNRSSYWVPTVVDSRTGVPIIPTTNGIYYKTDRPAEVVAPPAGLRMVAFGSATPTSATPGDDYQRKNRFTCNEDYGTRQEGMGHCPQGSRLNWLMHFPECWDGKNLDSPDHKSHMSYTNPDPPYGCPATHPVMIPIISYNVNYPVTTSEGTKYWRFSSDNYPSTSPGGYSGHGDWMNGWDEAFMAIFVSRCLKAGVDCHAHLLGDGRMFY